MLWAALGYSYCVPKILHSFASGVVFGVVCWLGKLFCWVLLYLLVGPAYAALPSCLLFTCICEDLSFTAAKQLVTVGRLLLCLQLART